MRPSRSAVPRPEGPQNQMSAACHCGTISRSFSAVSLPLLCDSHRCRRAPALSASCRTLSMNAVSGELVV